MIQQKTRSRFTRAIFSLVTAALCSTTLLAQSAPSCNTSVSGQTYNVCGSLNVSLNPGSYDTATGYNALAAEAAGQNDTAYGANAMESNPGGGCCGQNTAIGVNALATKNQGSANTAIGEGAFAITPGGSANTCIGFECFAGLTLTGGGQGANTGLGYHAGYNCLNATHCALGNVSGTDSLMLGVETGPNDSADVNETVIDAYDGSPGNGDNWGNGSNTTTIGNVAVTDAYFGSNGTGNAVTTIHAARLAAGILYSAAGTALPACGVELQGQQAVVSDATAPTYMGTYTSGGAITAAVICSYNGSSYAWLTH